MDDRIVNAINAQLTAKGWTLVQEGADVGVAAHVATKKGHTLQTFYSGFSGGWGWHHWGGGMGIATTNVETYLVGTLSSIFLTQAQNSLSGVAGPRTLCPTIPRRRQRNWTRTSRSCLRISLPSEQCH